MRKLLGDGVKLKDLEPHMPMLLIAFDLLTQTAQPRVVKKVTPTSVAFDMRNNISAMQIRRLIIEPLQKAMPEYEWTVNLIERTMTAERVETVGKKRKATKPVEVSNA